MNFAWELDQLRARDVLRQVASMLHVDNAVAGSVQDESGYAGGGEHVPHIDFAIHSHDCGCRARTCRFPEIGGHVLRSISIGVSTRQPRCDAERSRLAPMLLYVVEHALPLLLIPTERIVWRPGPLGI